jgi:hypothetical protein
MPYYIQSDLSSFVCLSTYSVLSSVDNKPCVINAWKQNTFTVLLSRENAYVPSHEFRQARWPSSETWAMSLKWVKRSPGAIPSSPTRANCERPSEVSQFQET